MENPTGLPAHEFGNITSLLLPDTNDWNPRQKAIAFQIDYFKLVMWIVGAVFPWVGIAALLLRL
jgi:hypothetical protein